MKLSEYIYTEMVEDGTLDGEQYDASDITRDFLMQETELGEEEIDDYIAQYDDYCDINGIEPDHDFE